MSARNTVHFTTSASDAPWRVRMSLTCVSAWRASALMPPGTTLPVAESKPILPDRNIRSHEFRLGALGAGSSDADQRSEREHSEAMATKHENFLLLKCGLCPKTLAARR